MSLMNVTAESLSRELDKEIPAMYVIIAKHSVMGMDSESIREILGCALEDIVEVETDPLYKDVRLYIGAAYAQSRVDQTIGWDFLEDSSLKRLAERIPHEKDPEFLLKVAAVANKAQRRQGSQNNVLDPTRANGRTAITLTQRLIKRLNAGEPEQIEERQISISDGSMKNPTFEEVDSILSVSQVIPRAHTIQAHTRDNLFDELEEELKDGGF